MKHRITLILLIVIMAGCSAEPAVVPTASPAPTIISSPIPPTTTFTPTPLPPTETPVPTQPPPEHRIAIRVVDGVGEFYDRMTGEKFIPRGNNFIRINQMESYSGEMMYYHSTFNESSTACGS